MTVILEPVVRTAGQRNPPPGGASRQHAGAAPAGSAPTGVHPSVSGISVEAEFTDFVRANSARLLHGAELLVGDRSRAEDLLQHALVGTYLKWASVREGRPEAYVRKAMLNSYLDWWRRRRWREAPLSDLTAHPTAADPSIDIVRRDLVRRALAGLTRRERAVIVLRYWFDLSESEIAAELGIATGTVKSTASRAMTRMRHETGAAARGELS